MFLKLLQIRRFSVMKRPGKYTGKTTSKIMECNSSPQLSALIKKARKEDPKHFGAFEISLAIKRYAQLKDYRSAFTLFNDVKNQSPQFLDQNLYSLIIKLCLDQYGHNIDTDSAILQKKRIKALQSSKKLFFEMLHEHELEPNEYVMTALISNCSKVITKKSLRMAEHHWKQIHDDDQWGLLMTPSVWNAMMTVYLKHFKLKKAMELLEEMNVAVGPDQTTYLLMINGFRLNCSDLICKSDDEYITGNQEENTIGREEMESLTRNAFKDCMAQHGAPSIEVFGCVIHNFAATGKVKECLSLIYFMRNERDHVLCDRDVINELGFNVLLESVVSPNVICYNLALKAILVHGENQLTQHNTDSEVQSMKYLEWTFIQAAVLEPMKSLEFSRDFFVTYKTLIRICEIKLDLMIVIISKMAENIRKDEETQDAYLSKSYQTDLLDVFTRLQECFDNMLGQGFKPNQTMFDQMYRMGFKFAKLCNDYPACFDNLKSDPLQPFNDWLVTQMKQHGLK